jgi:hypothetical protein
LPYLIFGISHISEIHFYRLRKTAIYHGSQHTTAFHCFGLRLLLILSIVLGVPACTPAPAAPAAPQSTEPAVSAPAVVDTNEPTLPPTLSPTLTHTPTPPPSVWIDPQLPGALRDGVQLPDGMVLADNPAAASMSITSGTGQDIGSWIYALAAPFPTIPDAVSASSLQSFWQTGVAPGFPAASLLVSPETLALLTGLWGNPSTNIQALPDADLLAAAWDSGNAWAILPFEQLSPRWKVIEIDGISPLHKDFDPAAYPLTLSINAAGDSHLVALLLALPANTLISNRNPDKLTTVMLTGVTALVRGTGALMRAFGNEYPATDIGPWLQEADILHINNEVPFAEICPLYPPQNELVFCSLPRYIELLEYIGTDVVELSGDHFHDYGNEAILYTLELYKERGWPVYGGGANLEEARRPLLMEHNGNQIAFLGCNGKAPWYARASEIEPGAWHCDIPWMQAEIARLRADGYLPIVTFQHEEIQTYEAHPKLKADFQPVADAGAVIVSGSQAHHPHAIEFRGDAFIHYGLGNLFFDQIYISDPNATAFIDRHIIYNGRHISTELLTIQFVDYARARPMTDTERQELLETIFRVSIWN